MFKKTICLLLTLFIGIGFLLCSCALELDDGSEYYNYSYGERYEEDSESWNDSSDPGNSLALLEDGICDDSKEEVAYYIYQYGCLPDFYMTKKEARTFGWESGSLDTIIKGKCIGGDKYGNYEGTLPENDGRQYYECDIDTIGEKGRGTKRIVYSNDGLVYYTEDHYNSFELLYGDDTQ